MRNRIEDASIVLEWSEAPWDGTVIGAPAMQLTHLEVRGPNPGVGMQAFESERDRLAVSLITCRLPHYRLIESMFLEGRDFRFIEMLYRPEVDLCSAALEDDMPPLLVMNARKEDLPTLLDIAGNAFSNERFHMDPRLGSALGNQRYRNWVASSQTDPDQQLIAVRDGERVVAMFIIEMLSERICYWHLTAVAPAVQGQGYGQRVWRAMMRHALQFGATHVRTSVAARNYRVINLYGQLGFRFSAPAMTFHWLRKPDK